MTVMERTDTDWPTWFGRRFGHLPGAFASMFDEAAIKVEEYQEDDRLVVRAELPGIDPDEDVEITIQGDLLHIRAERTTETRTEEQKGFRSEFQYGSFARSIRLPAGAGDDVTASYTDGILEVRVPIDRSEAVAKKVEISRR